MELTKLERRLLINQFEILKTIKPDEQEFYEEMIEILTAGYATFYSKLEEWLSDDMPVEDSESVFEILNLYRAIENFKGENKSKAIDEHVWGYFQGFDGNEETTQHLFVKFIINKQGRYEEQQQYRNKTDNFNSHWPNLERYGNMIAKWKEFDKRYDLTEAEILEILNS